MENKDLVKSENYDLQIKSKKEEITNLIKDTVSQYYGLRTFRFNAKYK